jgi:hypothetical protein
VWQVGEEEFVDHAPAGHADGFLLVRLLLPVLVSRVRCYHDPARHACSAHWDRWTIGEAAHGLAFRALLGLIGRQVQACLHERVLKDGGVFATSHKGEARHIGEHRPGAILAIKARASCVLEEAGQ